VIEWWETLEINLVVEQLWNSNSRRFAVYSTSLTFSHHIFVVLFSCVFAGASLPSLF